MERIGRGLLLALLAGLPAIAQDGAEEDDEEPTIEIGEGEGGEPLESPPERRRTPLPPPRAAETDGPPLPDDELARRVPLARAAALVWLRGRQQPDGSWGGPAEHAPALAAYVVSTLRVCGAPRSDRAARTGYRYALAARTGATTHESAAILLMTSRMHEDAGQERATTTDPARPPKGGRIPKRDWALVDTLVRHLTAGRLVTVEEGAGARTVSEPGCQRPNGGWGAAAQGDDADLFSTWLAVRALRAATRCGYPLPQVAPRTWHWVVHGALEAETDAGFALRPGEEPSRVSNVLGLGVLSVARQQLLPTGWIEPVEVRRAERAGWERLARDPGMRNPREDDRFHLFSMAAVAATCDIAGRDWQPWFAQGASRLLERQSADGAWTDPTCPEPCDVLATCFALRFLSSGPAG